MPYFKYLGVEAAKCYLKDCTVKYAQPNTYNDPFELLPEIRLMREHSSKDIPMEIDISGGKNEIDRFEIQANFLIEYKFRETNSLIEKACEKIGTTCFSESTSKVPVSVLMWAHYAESHKGIALQLKDESSLISHLSKIEYRANRPVIDGEKLYETRKIALRNLYIKSSHWSYESEYRHAKKLDDCTQIKDGLYVSTLNFSELQRIVLGVNASDEIKGLAWDFNKSFGTEVVFTRKSDERFGFTPCAVFGDASLMEAQQLFDAYQYESD
jgi:hypothetical protein